MKVLILGAAGMAGHVVDRFLLGRGYHVVTHARNSLFFDATYIGDLYENPKELETIISRELPEVVVNCAGVLVEASKNSPHIAAYINAYLPHLLVHLGSIYNFKIVHISTDCVFSGHNGSYHEFSTKDESSSYGLSKSLGEIINSRDCTIRTSIIGPEIKPHGSGLLSWFLRQTSPIQGYLNAYWNGVTTLELAKFIEKVICEKITGITNLCANQTVSKFELLQTFKKTYNHNIQINPHELKEKIDKTLIMTRADIGYEQQQISSMLTELRNWYE